MKRRTILAFQDREGRVHPEGSVALPLRQAGTLVLVQWDDGTRAIVPAGVLVHIERKGEGD